MGARGWQQLLLLTLVVVACQGWVPSPPGRWCASRGSGALAAKPLFNQLRAVATGGEAHGEEEEGQARALSAAAAAKQVPTTTDGTADAGGGPVRAGLAPLEEDLVQATIAKVEEDIREVGAKISKVEATLETGGTYLGMAGAELRGYLKDLLVERQLLREEKAALRKKEERLLAASSGGAVAMSGAGGRVPPAGVLAFWRALAGAREDGDGCLALPSGVFFMGDPDSGSRIFIRQCYRDLEWCIRDAIAQHGIRRVVLTGTPGIGKSCFAFYWLWLLWQEGKTMVYQLGLDFYRFSGDDVQFGTWDDFLHAGYLKDRDAWFLCDPEGPPYKGFAGTTLVFTSPRTDRYKEFLKAPAATTRYMPIWSLEELSSCRHHLFPHVGPNLMRQLFDQWGGVPRFVLQYAGDETQQAKLAEAVQKCTDAGVAATIAAAGEVGGTTDLVSDKVVHMYTTDYKRVQLRWASTHVFNKVCAAQDAALKQQLGAFLAASASDATLAGIRGKLFEPYVHKLLGAGGPFQYRVIDPPQPSVYTLPFQPRSTHTFTNLTELAVQPDVYYMPAAQNLRSADAFILIGGRLHILQVTVGDKHPVLAAGIRDILKAVPGNHADFVLCFVVPPDQFGAFKAQKFVYGNRTVASPQPFPSCQQWAVQIPL